MVLGHFAIAFAAKKASPKISLGTLFIAAQLLDLICYLLLILGLEQIKLDPGNTVVVPFAFVNTSLSHSLLAAIIWATLFAFLYRLFKHDSKGTICIWVVVTSHWVLDAISHRPDLPLYPGSNTLIGLGLWNSFTGTLFFESLLFFSGVVLYLRATGTRDRIGFYAMWSMILFLILMYAGSLYPPPPSSQAIAFLAFVHGLMILLAYWVDDHRIPT